MNTLDLSADLATTKTIAQAASYNNALNAIQAAINAMPKITTSTLASGPPGSPGDGDIWVATSCDGTGASTVGTRWMFQYDSAWVTDAYKWKFMGGAPAAVNTDANESTSAAPPVDLTTAQSYLFARAGIYDLDFGSQYFSNTANAQGFVELTKGGVDQLDISGNGGAVANTVQTLRRRHLLAMAAGETWKMQYGVGAGTGNFLNRYWYITPARII